jgi:hypothetical protein
MKPQFILVALVLATPAAAQSAADYNRANQALQICASPMGASIPECGKVRSHFGVGAPGGGGGGSNAAGIAGILGSALGSAQRSTAAPSMAPPSAGANPAAIQQAIAICVKSAAGDPAVIQKCLAIASAAPAAAARPTYAPTPGQVVTPSLMAGDTAARATHQAGVGYQACVASGVDWQTCVRRMNGGQ